MSTNIYCEIFTFYVLIILEKKPKSQQKTETNFFCSKIIIFVINQISMNKIITIHNYFYFSRKKCIFYSRKRNCHFIFKRH